MFPGVVLRKTSRKFDGLNPEAVRAYYNSHISNNIGITVLGVYFEDSLENAGRSIVFFFKDLEVPKLYIEILFGINGVII